MLELLVAETCLGGLDEGVVGVKRVLACIDYGFIEVHATAGEFIKTSKRSKEGGNFIELNHARFTTDKLQSLITTKAKRDFLVQTVITAGFARVKLAKVWLSNTEEARRAKTFLDHIKLNRGRSSANTNLIDKIKTKVAVISLFMVVDLLHVDHLLVRFPWIERRNEHKRHRELLGHTAHIGRQYAKTATAADTVTFIVSLDRPVAIWAFWRKLVG